jgi:hypothetical protein
MKDFLRCLDVGAVIRLRGRPARTGGRGDLCTSQDGNPGRRPDALTPAFAEDPTKQQQWTAFLKDVAVTPASLAEVIEDLAAFLMPHAEEARRRQLR